MAGPHPAATRAIPALAAAAVVSSSARTPRFLLWEAAVVVVGLTLGVTAVVVVMRKPQSAYRRAKF